ncbi:rabenosyn-5-like [Oscarella lobularis]|uniref:rabenosyn-5-like n=1 Tax=Oscarella lobularis TaxID=121494 RepID=UPI0033143110
MAADVKEGFLCSVCKRDMKSLPQLQEHFDTAHTRDRVVPQLLRGFFNKAKRIIMGEPVPGVSPGTPQQQRARTSSSTSEGGIDPALWDPQEIGAIRSHWDRFKDTRDRSVNQIAIETNKILIRLEKFVSQLEKGGKLKKDYEIVDWVPDSQATVCYDCKKSFSVSRRRHHCRLTGQVICGKCSQFLPMSFAEELLRPTMNFELKGKLDQSPLKEGEEKEQQPPLRVSTSCYKLLLRKHEHVQQKESRPAFLQLYEKMKSVMAQADAALPRYHEVAEALRLGDESTSLEKAQEMRFKLMKLHEAVDILSKKILMLDVQSDRPPKPRQLRIQKQTRQYATQYLQSNIIAMVPLPTAQQLQELQERNRRAQAERTKRERMEAQQAAERLKQKTDVDSSSVQMKRVSGPGWQPSAARPLTENVEEKDPLEIQRDMLLHYIAQAKQAGKKDELKALEESLKDIEFQLRSAKLKS